MILQIAIAGACLVDGFASGLYVGHKWAKSKLSGLGATIATATTKVEDAAGPVVTGIETAEDKVKTAEEKIAAALHSATHQAAVAAATPVVTAA